MLEKIKSPEDIKKCSYAEMSELCREIRRVIVDTVDETGGHLSSNLGIVEATCAIHRLFNSPEDAIIFDVGHQCYAHKLLTGRYDRFRTLRQFGGISGFTDANESVHDRITSGHCGTSISVALGIAEANRLSGNKNYAVAVVGDGAFTNGMIYEALNNCADRDVRLIIILNDNEMSISKNVGGLSKYLSEIRTSTRYFSLKHRTEKFLGKIPLIGTSLVNGAFGFKEFVKKVLTNRNLFEDFGVDYLGPVDGNDLTRLEALLSEAKSREKCCFIHILTKKGCGFEPAENDPVFFHSAPSGKPANTRPTFSDKFGEIMMRLAGRDSSICAITAAMCDGTGLAPFNRKYKSRFFDVGIAEEHAVTFASGLAAGGMKPVCALYSTFFQRTFDQVIHDVSLQKVPVVFAIDRAGLVSGDGVTHQGIFDYQLLSSVPGMTVYNPETFDEMEKCFIAAFEQSSAVAVRYPKGCEEDYDRSSFIDCTDLTYTEDESFDKVIITFGRLAKNATIASKLLGNTRVIKLIKTYPVDFDKLFALCGDAKLIYILEEGQKSCGFGEKCAAAYAGSRGHAEIKIHAIENTFVPHGDIESLFRLCGFTPEQIADELRDTAYSEA